MGGFGFSIFFGVPFIIAAIAVTHLPDLRSVKYALLGPTIFVPAGMFVVQAWQPGDHSEIAGLTVYLMAVSAVAALFPMMLGLTFGYWMRIALERRLEKGRGGAR